MDNPRAGTFCLLLAIGLGTWSVVNSLDNGQQRLRLRDPSNSSPAPVKTGAPQASSQAASIIDTLDPAYLIEGRVVDPGEKPIQDALVRCGNLEDVARVADRGFFVLRNAVPATEIIAMRRRMQALRPVSQLSDVSDACVQRDGVLQAFQKTHAAHLLLPQNTSLWFRLGERQLAAI